MRKRLFTTESLSPEPYVSPFDEMETELTKIMRSGDRERAGPN